MYSASVALLRVRRINIEIKIKKKIKNILPSVKSNDNSTINLKVNGIYYDKPDEVAEHFNDFFVNIGQKLANEISSSEISQCKSFLNDKVKNTIF